MGPECGEMALGEVSHDGASLTTGFTLCRASHPSAAMPPQAGCRGGEIARSRVGPPAHHLAPLPSARRRMRHVQCGGWS